MSELTLKNFVCNGCNCTKRSYKTNHYGNIYNIPCPVCSSEGRSPIQQFNIVDPIPGDANIPKPWTKTFIKIGA